MFRFFSLLFGIVFVLVGLLGFTVTKEAYLIYIFRVNIALNLFHLLIGLFAFVVAFSHPFYARLYFQIVGFLLALFAILGFLYSPLSILGLFANTLANRVFHLFFALVALILGFATPSAKNNVNENNQ